MTPFTCFRCTRTLHFTPEEVIFCKCGNVYRRQDQIVEVWDVNMVESKRPEWAQPRQAELFADQGGDR